MDTPTHVQTQPETFMPPCVYGFKITHAHAHTRTPCSSRDHMHGDTCSPSSMISLNMPVITERQEDPVHREPHTHTHFFRCRFPSEQCQQAAKLHINTVHCIHHLSAGKAHISSSLSGGTFGFVALMLLPSNCRNISDNDCTNYKNISYSKCLERGKKCVFTLRLAC